MGPHPPSSRCSCDICPGTADGASRGYLTNLFQKYLFLRELNKLLIDVVAVCFVCARLRLMCYLVDTSPRHGGKYCDCNPHFTDWKLRHKKVIQSAGIRAAAESSKPP